MKKLMIAVAIVCAAAISQAATADWAAAKTFALDDPNQGDYPVTFTYAIAELLSADVSGVSFANGVLTGATQVGNTGTFNVSAWSDQNPYGTLAGDAGKYYALCIWSDDYQNWGVSDAVLATANPTDMSGNTLNPMTFSNLDGDPYAAGGLWTQDRTMSATESVPEPTSGLLLLLGVAGLALRRRRA